MSASKTSAVADEPIDVLVALHPKFDLLDFAGPVEVFTNALHDAKDESEFQLFHLSGDIAPVGGNLIVNGFIILTRALPRTASRAFEITTVGAESQVFSEQGIMVGAQITWKEAHDRLEEFDILVILGGNSAEILKKEDEPCGLICDFSELQKKDPARERTMLSVCTGALFLAQQGILSGLSATTHPDYFTKFENLCSDAATRNLQERTDVVEDARYVVNNLRFDLEDEDESPYIRRKSDAGTGRRPSNAR